MIKQENAQNHHHLGVENGVVCHVSKHYSFTGETQVIEEQDFDVMEPKDNQEDFDIIEPRDNDEDFYVV